MHAIRRAARRDAWFHNEDEQNRTYNPFGRSPRNSKSSRMSKDDGLPPISNITSNQEVLSPVQSRENISSADEKGNSRPTDSIGNGSNKASDDTVVESPQNEANYDPEAAEPKPRQRKLNNLLHPGKREDDTAIDRQPTTDSQKAKKAKWNKNPDITVRSQIKATIFGSWINVLLVMVPVGIGLNYSGVDKVAVFVVNFISIIPLAAMLSYSTEELALYVGETLGGLLNATFGNAVELIVSIIALQQKKILIVQTSLIGSMLSNLLLVMGMCFFFGGLKRKEQFFNITVAQTAASLLAIAIGALIIPTAFQMFASNDSGVAPVSRATSILLLVVYGCYLFFQLKTHIDMYNEPGKKVPKDQRGRKDAGDMIKGLATIGAGTGAAAAGGEINQQNLVQEEDEEPELPQLTVVGALVTLAGSTVLVALCAEYMVSSINAISGSVSQEFIGLILLPIVGNAAEHATAVTVAIKDKMDLAIGVAVGSSLQIALLVLPLMVVINWIGLGQPDDLTFAFDGFLIIVIFIAVVLVNYLIGDGKSHWLEGVLLQALYLIIAVAAWFYPAKGDVAG